MPTACEPVTSRRLVYGDGAVPCPECQVALNHTGSPFCVGCGAPLQAGLTRWRPDLAALQVGLTQMEAAAEGVSLA